MHHGLIFIYAILGSYFGLVYLIVYKEDGLTHVYNEERTKGHMDKKLFTYVFAGKCMFYLD